MRYLKLHLKAPFMYFASDSRRVHACQGEPHYSTTLHPTYDTVAGILAAALGMESRFANKNSVIRGLDIKYETVKAGREFIDFQTVHPFVAFRTLDNKVKGRGANTMIKHVHYLSDAEFYVYVGADDDRLDKFETALKNPKYDLYIGKRCCFPSAPIIGSIVNSEDLPKEVLNV